MTYIPTFKKCIYTRTHRHIYIYFYIFKYYILITKASLVAGVRFALATYCRETGHSSRDFSFRTGFGAPWLEMIFISNLYPPPPAGSNPAASIQNVGAEKGVNIQTYRHKDADIDIEYRYRIYIYIGHINIYIYIFDVQAQSASTEDASVEALCHHLLDVKYSYIHRIFKEIYDISIYIYLRYIHITYTVYLNYIYIYNCINSIY